MKQTALYWLGESVGLFVTLIFCGQCLAEPDWRGDFESADMTQWHYLLNEAGLSIAEDLVLEGRYSGRIAISGDHLWPNGLNRVEFQYRPIDATIEGQQHYIAWSFLLPARLNDSEHILGYWETEQSYRQLMSVRLHGDRLAFTTSLPDHREVWSRDSAVQTGTWHRVVIGVNWSSDPTAGWVDVWFDGEAIVERLPARTFYDFPAFFQLGLLRQPTLSETELLFVDCALAGRRYQDVVNCQ